MPGRFTGPARAAMSKSLLRWVRYVGSSGEVWFIGSQQRAPSVVSFFAGEDANAADSGRILRNGVIGRIDEIAQTGALPILQLADASGFAADLLGRSIQAPTLVDLHTELPADPDDLRAQLRTSTTKEDLRRIRRAEFSYRITTDRSTVRTFHDRHYRPLVETRFPDDGTVGTAESMVRKLDAGGELICASQDDDWIAGIYNVAEEGRYALGSLGIRDADPMLRQTRVTSALIVRSLERAVELGYGRASLGRSLPFLGKGPIWFKAKWGGRVTLGNAPSLMHLFIDVRNAGHRLLLASNPPVHIIDGRLAASTWLEPGEDPLRATTREIGRYPGIERWHVLGLAETLASAASLGENANTVLIPVPESQTEPLWVGRLVAEA